MYFKLVSKNGYRDLVRNARRICVSQLSEEEKSAAFVELYGILKDKLFESTRSLNVEAAYADRCIHWNQNDLSQIKPVNNMRNPWLRFKREFEQCLDGGTPSKSIEQSLAWFYAAPYRDDWIAS